MHEYVYIYTDKVIQGIIYIYRAKGLGFRVQGRMGRSGVRAWA